MYMSSHDSVHELEPQAASEGSARESFSPSPSPIKFSSRQLTSPNTTRYDGLHIDSDQSSGRSSPVNFESLGSPEIHIGSPTAATTWNTAGKFNEGITKFDPENIEDEEESKLRPQLLLKHELKLNECRPRLVGLSSPVRSLQDKKRPTLGSVSKPRSFTDYYDIKTTLSVALSPAGDSEQLENEGAEDRITQSFPDCTSRRSANQLSTAEDALQVHHGLHVELTKTEQQRKQQPYVRNPSYVKAQTEGNILLPHQIRRNSNDPHHKDLYRVLGAPDIKVSPGVSDVPSCEYESEGPVRKPRAGSSASTGSGENLTVTGDGLKKRKISSAGIASRYFRPSIGSSVLDPESVCSSPYSIGANVHRDDESVTSDVTSCSLEVESITQSALLDAVESLVDSVTPVASQNNYNADSLNRSSRNSSVSSQNSSIKYSKITKVPNLTSFTTPGSSSVVCSRRSSADSEKDSFSSRLMMSGEKVEHQDGVMSPSAIRKPPLPLFFDSSFRPGPIVNKTKQQPKGKEALKVLNTDWQSYMSLRSLRSPSPSLPRTSPPKSPRASPTQLDKLSSIFTSRLIKASHATTKTHESRSGLKSTETNTNLPRRSDSSVSNRSLSRPGSKQNDSMVPRRSLSLRETTRSPEIMVTPPSSPSLPTRGPQRRHAVTSLTNQASPRCVENKQDNDDVFECSPSVLRSKSEDMEFTPRRVSTIEEDEGLEADYTPTSERFNKHERVEMKGTSVEEQSAKRGSQRRNDTSSRFVTHPPDKSVQAPSKDQEGGTVDSNGFGPLRGGELHPHPGELTTSSEISSMSLPDSCAGVSITSEAADIANMDSVGWRGKKPWRSDPSGNKREAVDLPTVITSAQAQSTPSLTDNQKQVGATKKVHSEDVLASSQCLEQSNSELKNIPATVVTPSTPMQRARTKPPPLVHTDRKADTLPLPGQSPKTKLSRSRSEAFMHSIKRPGSKSKQLSSSVGLPAKNSSGEMLSPSSENLWAGSDFNIQSPTSPVYKEFSSSVDLTWPCDDSRSPSRKQTPSPAESTCSVYQDKRFHIVEELKNVEQEYVDAMAVLFKQYVVPLKDGAILDPAVVNEMFYNIRIPEIFNHHAVFLALLSKEVRNWTQQTTIGDIVVNTFSKPTVEESYMSYIKNYTKSRDLIEHYLQNKGAFQKFLEQAQKGNKRKLGWKDLIIQPTHRIPRYGLLLKRLMRHTSEDHPDFKNIEEAIKVINKLASIINCEDGEKESDHHNTLKKIEELLSISDLAVAERTYLRHDLVQVVGKKDQCCIWTFSDMLVLTTIKRRTGPINKRTSVLLKSPTGQDFVENFKQKIWKRISLEDVEVYNSPDTLTRKRAKDKDFFDEDLQTLKSVADITSTLHCEHQALDSMIRDMMNTVNNKLTEYELRSPPLDLTKLEIIVTLLDCVSSLTVQFSSADKRSSWEQSLAETKQKLSTLTDRLPPVFLQYLPITKTRAGMQFSCAAPIDGLNANHFRDVWVCNSDGYVGHMCLLSLQPEPIVPQNTPVPGCNAKIMCICAVPAWTGGLKRKPSRKIPQSPRKRNELLFNQASVSMESTDFGDDEDSSSSDEEGSIQLHLPSEQERPSSPSLSDASTKESPSLDPRKSTMWLGTDDGFIHIFPCSENIKVTRNKLRIPHSTAVLYMVYFDHKVFVSLNNGDLIIYERTEDGCWDKNRYRTIPIGTVTTPITRMLCVAGKIWCSRGNEVLILEPNTRTTESFQVSPETSLQPVLSMALSRQGVCAIALQGSLKVSLFHSTKHVHLMDVSIAQAVAQKLQTADDIIRQHKTACLKITALLAVKDLLWVGTSAGVILTIPLPKITATTTKMSLQQPQVTGLPCGHTGHVRFLTCVEMPMQLVRKYSPMEQSSPRRSDGSFSLPRRLPVQPTTMATKMMVISGGDGFEDFRVNANNEAAGKEDSTNHLLLWQV